MTSHIVNIARGPYHSEGVPLQAGKDKVIYTIGYEGLKPERFVEILVRRGIEDLIDVRELPLSRKNGFSKNALKGLLESNGVGYTHIAKLGSPRDLRKALKQNHDYKTFFEKYNEYLDKQKEEINNLRDMAAKRRICLMCFESNWRQCHRSAIAQRLQDTYEIVHL